LLPSVSAFKDSFPLPSQISRGADKARVAAAALCAGRTDPEAG